MKTKNLKRMTLDEVKSVELEILKYVADFCENHKINYILSDGTLLGAIRHNGFIPWDDDIDISMLRADYEKFIELWCKERHGKFNLLCTERGNYIAGFSKVINSDTLCYEGNLKNPVGCWIDIFPLDFVPENNTEKQTHYDEMMKMEKYWYAAYWVKIEWKILYPLFTVFFALKRKDFHYLFLYDAKYVISVLKNKVQKYPSGKFVTNYIIMNPSPPQRKFGFPASCCMDYVYHKFEQYEFRIPRDYDSVLKSFYGNYMQLPPEEERIAQHGLIAYWK